MLWNVRCGHVLEADEQLWRMRRREMAGARIERLQGYLCPTSRQGYSLNDDRIFEHDFSPL